MSASEVLVIILSIFLALFLLLAIILTVLLIRVTQQIKSVTTTAQTAVERISSVAETAGKVVSPAIALKFVTSFLKKSKK